MEKQLTNRDWCLSPEEEKVFKPTTQAVANANGEYALAQVEVLQQSFMDNMVADPESNPVVIAVKKYGDAFDTNLNLINKFINTSSFVAENLPNYEILNTRITNGAITQFEFAQFIDEFNYSPISANYSANQDPPKFLKNLDDFYRGSFSKSVMGGFCSVLPNVFGAIGGFFIILGQVEGLIGDALSFIAKIRNIEDPIKALFEAIKVKALIEAIKKKITKTVMGAIEKIQSAIENFNMADVMGKVENFVQNKIIDKVTTVKDQIMRAFSPENLKKIKSKITGMIDYAVGLFDNPSLEEIMFLMMRICGFASGVEAILGGLKAPLDNIKGEYEQTLNILKGKSALATSSVVRSGAIRFTPEERAAKIAEQKKIWQSYNSEIATTSLPDIDLESRATQPAPMPTDGTISELGELPTWTQIKLGRHPVFVPYGGWTWKTWPNKTEPILGSLGWTQTLVHTKILILRLNKRMNELHSGFGSFRLASLYRNEEYQRFLRSEGGKPASKSQHLLGKAVDIKVNGWTQQMRTDLVNEGRKLGFTSFGWYKGNQFIHLDWRAKNIATWGRRW